MGKQEELTESDLRLKISSFCAYQERSPKQVIDKLNKLSDDKACIKRVYDWALKEKFLSENRFIESFVRGKVNLKKWGRFKIKGGLLKHNIDETLINKALFEIDEQEYREGLLKLGMKKFSSLKKNDNQRWQKTIRFLIGRGFEADLINELKEEIKNE